MFEVHFYQCFISALANLYSSHGRWTSKSVMVYLADDRNDFWKKKVGLLQVRDYMYKLACKHQLKKFNLFNTNYTKVRYRLSVYFKTRKQKSWLLLFNRYWYAWSFLAIGGVTVKQRDASVQKR